MKRTPEEKVERAREIAAAYYAANKAKVLARQALKYLESNPQAKMRPSTALKYGIIKEAAKDAVPPASRVRAPLTIAPIKQTPIDPVTSEYPPLSYLGIRDWLANRIRPKDVKIGTIKAQQSAWKQIMELMRPEYEAIDNVIPILNNPLAIRDALKKKYPNVSSLQKPLELLWQITKFNDEVLLLGKRGLYAEYRDIADANDSNSKSFEKSKQTDPAYAVPEFQYVMDTVKEKLGEDSQFYLFLNVYRDTVGRDDYGELRIAETLFDVDLKAYPNWFVKNGDARDPNKFDPIILVKSHKTGTTSQGGIPKALSKVTQGLLKKYFALPAHQTREWLFVDESTDKPFIGGKLGSWIMSSCDDVGLYGVQQADLRQSMSNELKAGEKSIEDSKRNAELMGHTLGKHLDNYGRMSSNEIKKNKENTQIEPTFKLTTKIAQRGRERETTQREAREKVALSVLSNLSKGHSDTIDVAELLGSLKHGRRK